MDAMKMVEAMYNKLEAAYNFTNLVTPLNTHDFEGFSVVNCSEYNAIGPDETFYLIVFEDGRIINNSGDDVYEILSEVFESNTTAQITILCDGCLEDITRVALLAGKLGSDYVVCPTCGYKLSLRKEAGQADNIHQGGNADA